MKRHSMSLPFMITIVVTAIADGILELKAFHQYYYCVEASMVGAIRFDAAGLIKYHCRWRIIFITLCHLDTYMLGS